MAKPAPYKKEITSYMGWHIFRVGDRYEAHKGHKMTYKYRTILAIKRAIGEIEYVGK